ncbi:MAG TPA: hemerythrin domain-containing protein [Myxococcaceae bacterium]|nr:hemerythrin domain-containing protein [Myxococcaceae bacterium]
MSGDSRIADGAGRRRFLRSLAPAAGFALAAWAVPASPGEGSDEAEVTPGEDLMQEHGVLERLLLVYDESARRIEHGRPLELAVLTSAGGLIRRFVEDYHEKLEERFVFPRLEAARREVSLVAVLRRQHQRGRELTEQVLALARGPKATPQLTQLLRDFERMYRPHAAREDTVLFPAFRTVVGGRAYRELGDQFEDEEHARFGEHGFENVVGEVAQLEARLGIGDLARFTPP